MTDTPLNFTISTPLVFSLANISQLYLDRARQAMAAGDYKNAAETFNSVLADFPDDANLRADLAIALRRIGQMHPAYIQAQAAVNLEPDHTVALNELGNIFRLMGQADAAVECFRHSVESWPTWQAAHNVKHFNEAELRANLGVALAEQCNYAAAVAEYERALTLDPDCRGAQWNLPLALLMLERFAEGWEAYERRFETGWMEEQRRDFGRPRWNGEAIPPLQKLHIWGEQGVGDEILYASMLANWCPGFEVVLECNPKLEKLFKRAFPHFTVVAKDATPHPAIADESVVAQIPMGSLATYLRPDWRTSLPAAYLSASPSLSLIGGLTVGIAWSSPNAKVAVRKSIPLELLSPIFQVEGVQFIDLQYGGSSESWHAIQAKHPELDVTRMGVDHFHDLNGHAALIASCDLVITVSNTTAHLAGAMGKETWVLPPKGQGQFWYWFQERDDSLAYPGVKLFRQETPGDFSVPVARVAEALKEKAHALRKYT